MPTVRRVERGGEHPVGRVAPGRLGLLPLAVEGRLFAFQVQPGRGQQGDPGFGQALLERRPDRPVVAGGRLRLAVEGDEGAGEEAVAVHDHGRRRYRAFRGRDAGGEAGTGDAAVGGDAPGRSARPLRFTGPVTAGGGFPLLPTSADEFDQESAAALFAILGEFFDQRKEHGRRGRSRGARKGINEYQTCHFVPLGRLSCGRVPRPCCAPRRLLMLRKIAVGTSAAVVAVGLAAAPALATGRPARRRRAARRPGRSSA